MDEDEIKNILNVAEAICVKYHDDVEKIKDMFAILRLLFLRDNTPR